MSRNSGKNARKGINSEFGFLKLYSSGRAKQQDYLTAIII